MRIGRAVLQALSNISEEYTTTIFRVQVVNMEAIRLFEKLLTVYNAK